MWHANTINTILRRREYAGHKVLGKTVCENYKTKYNRKTEPEEQYVFENAIPAIIDEETWQTVQKILETKRRPPKGKSIPSRLTGLLYCADCGSKLTHRNNLVQGKWRDDSFTCSSYRKLTRDCTMHYISSTKLENIILSVIQRVSWYAQNNEADFVERVQEASAQTQKENVKEWTQKIERAQKRHRELDILIKKLYEGNATGKMPDNHFTRLLSEYDKEQREIESVIGRLQEQVDSWNAETLKQNVS